MTLIYFILILSATIFVHELGHFLFAKRAGIHVYELSIGMGKKIFSFHRKNDETEYCLKLIPIGGSVALAGEEVEDDQNIPKEKKLQSKPFLDRFLTMFAGAGFNFLFAFILLFIIGLFFGSNITKPVMGPINEEYPAYQAGIREGDVILKINNSKVKTWDETILYLQLNAGKTLTFELKDNDNNYKTITVAPTKLEENGETSYIYGISTINQKHYGFIPSISYAYHKTMALFKTMFIVFENLFTGGLSIKDLSGPVGIYSIVNTQAKAGFESLLYLVAFLSINVGFVNLIPFPAFDGGRILFLVIEKVKGSPINPKIENTIHNIGFLILMVLMVYVAFNDILRIFK